jgi:hypothetical protein
MPDEAGVIGRYGSMKWRGDLYVWVPPTPQIGGGF